MTDPEFADRTYIEPLTWKFVEKIIEAERPDALLPTLGGQTALESGDGSGQGRRARKIWRRDDRREADAIDKGEDRELFKQCMLKIGLDVAEIAHGEIDGGGARRSPNIWVFPLIIRPSLHAGRQRRRHRLQQAKSSKTSSRNGLDLSPVHEVLIEESLSAGKNTRWR